MNGLVQSILEGFLDSKLVNAAAQGEEVCMGVHRRKKNTIGNLTSGWWG